MTECSEQRICIKFCCRIGKTASETYELHKIAYGDDAMGRTQVFKWFRRFKEGRSSVKSDPRSGRPSTSTNDEMVEKVEKVRFIVRNNGRLTARELAEEVGISVGSCEKILAENSGTLKSADAPS